jgi:hypothetical protein
LNDDGSPSYDHDNAKKFNEIGVPVFGCTPDLFPDMMAAAIMKQDITQRASQNDVMMKG